MIYVVDLDDTLVCSTMLNNDSYNYALECFGYNRLTTNERITRERLDFVDDVLIKDIILLKQYYFIQEWLPYRVIINKLLLNKLSIYKKENCYLWTKADKNRAFKILSYCNLNNYFKDIIYDDKSNFESSILKLRKVTNSNRFIIYENNRDLFKNQKCKVVDVIKNKFFNVKGYLIG